MSHHFSLSLLLQRQSPGFKGDTATGATKPATVETGATVYVPLLLRQMMLSRLIQEQVSTFHVYNLYFMSLHIFRYARYVQAFLFVCCVAGENPDSKCHKHMRHKHSPQICIYPIVGTRSIIIRILIAQVSRLTKNTCFALPDRAVCCRAFRLCASVGTEKHSLLRKYPQSFDEKENLL